MSPDVPVVIAAAGLGSRLGLNTPKALVRVGGMSIIERLLRTCLKDAEDIRVITGFRGMEVIEHVRAIRPDAIFVRNPNFRAGTVADSFSMAIDDCPAGAIVVDGDLVVDPASWHAFVSAAAGRRYLLGICSASTQDAVYTATTGQGADLAVTSFSRSERHAREWCGIAKADADLFANRRPYLFETFEKALPLPAFVLDVKEVDTPSDMAAAEEWLAARSKAQG